MESAELPKERRVHMDVPLPRNGKKAFVVLTTETGGFKIIPTVAGSEEPTETEHVAATNSASSSKDGAQERAKNELEDAIEPNNVPSIEAPDADHTAAKSPAPSDNSAESVKNTDAVFKSQVAALIEAHGKLIEGAPSEAADTIENMTEILEEMKKYLLKLKVTFKAEESQIEESKVEGPKAEESQSPTDTTKTGIGASFQDVAAKLGEIEDLIKSDVAAVAAVAVDISKDKADNSSVKAKVNAPLIVASKTPSSKSYGLPDYAKFKGAPGVEASRGQIFDPGAKKFVPSHNREKSSRSSSQEANAPLTVREQPSETQSEATPAIAPTEPQEVAVTLTTAQTEEMKTEATANNTAPQEVAATVPTAQTEEAKAGATENNVAPQATAAQATAAQATAAQATATQARPTVNWNPNFAAGVKRVTYDKEEAQTRLVEDIDWSERDCDPETLCIVCDKPSTNLCDRCKHAKYCSRKCQVADWALHKKVCAHFAGAAADDKRPSPEHRRILFFPTFTAKPELLWAIHHETDDNKWLEFDHLDLDVFRKVAEVESPGQRKGHSVLNLMHTLGNRRIGHMLTAITWTVANPTSNPLQPKLVNQSINALSKPGYLRPWFGPVSCFADARRPREPVPPKIRDVTARDVHSLVRLIELCDSACVDKPDLYYGETISGLRVSDVRTDINVAMGVKHVFDMTNVPIRPVNSSDYVIAMAFHLGLRWYIRPGNLMGLRSDVTVWSDGNLRYLGYVCAVHEVVPNGDQDSSSATPPPPPRLDALAVLHGSGNPVHVDHVLAFNAYLDDVYVRKGAASKAEFQKFWAAYKQEAGGPLSSVPSPYKWEKASVVDKLGFFDPAIVMDKVRGNIRDAWMQVVDVLNGFNAEMFEVCKRKGKTRG